MVWAGTLATEIGAAWAGLAWAAASLRRSSGSGMAVKATRALVSMSHCALCWVARLLPSAALARAMAASDGARKPAWALIAVRRAVSSREAASRCAKDSNWLQVDRL